MNDSGWWKWAGQTEKYCIPDLHTSNETFIRPTNWTTEETSFAEHVKAVAKKKNGEERKYEKMRELGAETMICIPLLAMPEAVGTIGRLFVGYRCVRK